MAITVNNVQQHAADRGARAIGAFTARAVPPAGSEAVAAPTAQAATALLRRLAATRTVTALCAFALFVGLWYGVSAWINNRILVPSPTQVATALVQLGASGELFTHALVSTSRLGMSLIASLVLAVPLGFAMGMNEKLNAYLDPVVELLRPISGIAWIPIGLFIFGVGDTLPVFIMVYVAFFPLLLNTIAGVRNVDRKLIDAARTMGVRRTPMLLHVVVPAALPTIMVGFRLAFAGAWSAIIAAELIGAPSGLGFAIEWYRELLMSPKMFAFIVLIGIVGYVCDLLLRALQRVLTPWAEGTGLA
ncbi:MAG TPA: ABC transporter permease [Casimicrobiaceae bacterium]|nr:ABC transporter permease [Casimicrobiaceae bacterium]